MASDIEKLQDEPRLGLLFILQETFWIFALAAIAGFVFLLLLGAFSVAEMWQPALVLLVLAVGWLTHAKRVHSRQLANDDPALHTIRERRGF
jgi:hypothetical protein